MEKVRMTEQGIETMEEIAAFLVEVSGYLPRHLREGATIRAGRLEGMVSGIRSQDGVIPGPPQEPTEGPTQRRDEAWPS